MINVFPHQFQDHFSNYLFLRYFCIWGGETLQSFYNPTGDALEASPTLIGGIESHVVEVCVAVTGMANDIAVICPAHSTSAVSV